MEINFTGIRNASYIIEKTSKGSFPIKDRILNVQLTNDAKGYELSDFINLTKPTGKHFINPFHKDFINIDHFSINKNDMPTLYLNGEPLVTTDEHLPLFSFIAKLTKKIAKMPEEEFINDLGYLKSAYADKALLMSRKISEELDEPFPHCLERFHQPDKIKKGAAKINNLIQEMMAEYFA